MPARTPETVGPPGGVLRKKARPAFFQWGRVPNSGSDRSVLANQEFTQPFTLPEAPLSAVEVLKKRARKKTSSKWAKRHSPGPEVSVLANNEFTQQLNLRTRLARSLMLHVLNEVPVALRAHENPKLAHHSAPHAKRVEYTLHGLILNTTNPLEQDILEKHPEILGAAMIFPRAHDFWHQVLTGQRKLEQEGKFNAKHGHGKGAGLVMAAQAMEYAESLRKVYKKSRMRVSEEHIQKEAITTMLLAQIISSPHDRPSDYEKVIGQRTKKAYTVEHDEVTGKDIKVPRLYQTEDQAKALFEDYMNGDIDVFSMNQAQMMAITTYEITHSQKGAFDPEYMKTYEYGKEPYGLHPEMFMRYGDTLTVLAADQTPFEDLLPPEIMEQRDLIEYMGKLALFSDTFDLVSDPTGRVIRSLLTQVTFTGDNPRPVWPSGLNETDIDAMLKYATESNGDDTRGDGATERGYSLTRRLDWEIKHWFPFTDTLDPQIATLLGEVTVMAQLEQFRIIEAWMDDKPNLWSEPLRTFYNERVTRYDEKLKKRDPRTVFDSSWLREESQEVPAILHGLPYATEFTEQDREMLRLYKEKSLEDTQNRYGVTKEQMAQLRELSAAGKRYESPFITPMYDIVFSKNSDNNDTPNLPPLRELELRRFRLPSLPWRFPTRSSLN